MIIFLPFAIVSQLSTYCCIWNRSEACTGLPFASEPLHKQFLTLLPRTFFPPPFPTLSSRNLSGPEVAPLLPGYLPFLLCARAPKQNKVKQNSVWGFWYVLLSNLRETGQQHGYELNSGSVVGLQIPTFYLKPLTIWPSGSVCLGLDFLIYKVGVLWSISSCCGGK